MQTTDDAAAVEIGKVILLRMLNALALGKNRQGNAAQTAPTSSRSVRQECDAAKMTK